ncbi:hypothetical protein MAR_021804 [Mya arenaria]|uniref:Ig-like domain-containing protein n=1 Tax=Mya arenaria TaxID=6604 RepID=A0ABY7E9B4_MYAAR|nr:hypothetical protein MAR_021804 [Mya arenaria]
MLLYNEPDGVCSSVSETRTLLFHLIKQLVEQVKVNDSLVRGKSQQTTLTPTNPIVIENGTLTLTCKSTNDNPSYITWLRDNIAIGIIDNIGNDTCTPPDPSSGPNKTVYDYECQGRSLLTLTIKRVTSLSHGAGWKCSDEIENSNAINISVIVPPSEINITDPSSSIASFVENTTFTFTCTVTRTIPQAEVTWFYSNRTIDDTAIHQSVSATSKLNSDRTFSTASVLSLFGTRYINEGNIYCTANANNGSAIPPKEAPSIIEVNSGYEYSAIRNKSQTLTCTVLGGNPAPNITWDCTGGEMGETNYSSLVGPSTPVLSLVNATVFDKGTVSVIKGLNYEIECFAKSNPEADNYTWTFSNSDKVTYSETLNITAASERAIGEYTCEVSNTMVPTVDSPTKPNFYYGDLNDSLILNENLVMLRNETIDVKCVSYSRPGPPIYVWNLTNPPTVRRLGKHVVVEDKATVTSITFSGVPVDPVMEINQNDNVEFSCLVDSLPGSNISFALNSKAVANIQNATELTFKKEGMTCENDSGRYRCSAANMFNTEPDEQSFQINASQEQCLPFTLATSRHDRNRNEVISMSEKDLNPYAEIGEDIVGSKGPRGSYAELSATSSVRREPLAPPDKGEAASSKASDDYLHPVGGKKKEMQESDNNLKKEACNSGYMDMDVYANSSDEDDSNTKAGDRASYLNLKVAL